MVNNTVPEDGRAEIIDGKEVTLYEVKFGNTIEIDNDFARGLAVGDSIGFMVTGTVGIPTFAKADKSGDSIKKVIKITMVDMKPMSVEKAYKLYDQSLLDDGVTGTEKLDIDEEDLSINIEMLSFE